MYCLIIELVLVSVLSIQMKSWLVSVLICNVSKFKSVATCPFLTRKKVHSLTAREWLIVKLSSDIFFSLVHFRAVFKTKTKYGNKNMSKL